jgi:hypothetical protein
MYSFCLQCCFSLVNMTWPRHLYNSGNKEDRVGEEHTMCAITASSLNLRRADTWRPLTQQRFANVFAAPDLHVTFLCLVRLDTRPLPGLPQESGYQYSNVMQPSI